MCTLVEIARIKTANLTAKYKKEAAELERKYKVDMAETNIKILRKMIDEGGNNEKQK